MNEATILRKIRSSVSSTFRHYLTRERKWTHPARLPTPMTIAITTPRFISPPIFAPVHASVHGTHGNMPHVAMIVPAYPAPGDDVPYKTAYPASARSVPAIMTGPRTRKRSDSAPARMVVSRAQRFGGMVSSCACEAENPSPEMIVGRKSAEEYEGMKMLRGRLQRIRGLEERNG